MFGLQDDRLDETKFKQSGESVMQTHGARLFAFLLLGASLVCTATPAVAQQTLQTPPDGVLGAIAKSLTGDVYSDATLWRELSVGTLFTEGWDRAWVSPPPGGGGAPRQGWLNSFDGVFYRLA